MKKTLLFIAALTFTVSAFAHDHFLYTSNLDVSGKKEIKMKTILGHPSEGKKAGPLDVAIANGVAHLPDVFFVVHDSEKKDLLSKAKLGKLIDGKNEKKTIDATYGVEDGLKGSGSWVFFMVPGVNEDSGYTFRPTVKLIVTKDSAGSDYNKRVADGYNEIIPLLNPVKAWKENVFRAKFVDKDGKAIKNARVDVDFLNAVINVDKDTWVGGNEKTKTSVRVFTDDNGVFAFTPSRAGQWIIRAVKKIDKEKKAVSDSSLVVQFE